MKHPEAVIKKARQVERLLLRMEAGESFEQVRAELGLEVEIEDLPKLQSRYAAGGKRFEMLIDGRYGHYQTINSAMREWLYEQKRQDENVRACQLAEEMKKEFGVGVTVGHINYLLRKRGLTNAVGRPKQPPQPEVAAAAIEEKSSQPVENVGIFFPGGSEGGDESHGMRRGAD